MRKSNTGELTNMVEDKNKTTTVVTNMTREKDKGSTIVISIIIFTVLATLIIFIVSWIFAFLNPPPVFDEFAEQDLAYLLANAEIRNPNRQPNTSGHLETFFHPAEDDGEVALLVFPGLDFEVYYEATKVDGFFGEMQLESPQDPITVLFHNSTDIDLDVILKVFYNYEEVPFRVFGTEDYNTELLFTLNRLYEAMIPIQLDGNLEVNERRNKLTVAVFFAPDVFVMEIEALAEAFGAIGLNFEMSYGGDEALTLTPTDIDIAPLDGLFAGFKINDDFEPITGGIRVPPNPLQVSAGEEIELGFVANAHSLIPEDVESYVIISMLDWHQIPMNGEPYFFIYTEADEDVGQHGRFTITAPDEPGFYEFAAFIVPNPTHPPSIENFFLLEFAMRFTIEVIE